MRRLAYIAAFALVLAVPVWAQRGGHAGGGGHSGFSGGMHGGGFAGHGGGHIAGGRSFSGVRSGGMRSAPVSSRGFHHPSGSTFNHGSTWNHGSHGHHHHNFNHFAHNTCNGFGCSNWGWGWSSPWWGWGYSDPWLWSSWDEQDRRFNEEYDRQYEMAAEWNRQNLEEIRMRRQEDEDGDQDAYAPRSSERRASSASEAQPQPALPATVLVYRDQHKEEVSNYAIVGQTLWNFSSQRTKKIPLADLDMAATEKANDDRGVAFNVPATHSGQ